VKPDLPSATVTFLFTDIEGSTRLLRELGESYSLVQDDHARLVREAIAAGDGTEIRTEGDSFFAVFPTATGAVRATASAQRALATHTWSHGGPVRVRMGMHTGEGRLGGGDYLGIDVNRAARIAATGHGGQVLVSDATRALVGAALPDQVSVRDLGERRLKNFDTPQRIHQLVIEGLPSDFPAIRSLDVPTNLPVQLTTFVGREQELADIIGLVERSRLVTLTGPGGTGKTRLAVEAAGRLAERFLDGVHFVDLSPITDPGLVANAIASTLRLREEGGRAVARIVSDHLRDRTALLVLDNFEQILTGGEVVATLLRTAPRLRALATSRAPLGLAGEHEFPVRPSPHSVLERLGQSLPLPVGGPRDAPERQRTLRAAIGWSYDLLEERVRTFLRGLSVFGGGWSLAMAGEVVADPQAEGTAMTLEEAVAYAREEAQRT
jgi:class 3 adenylate cyclase